jgi:hypothetical protein
MNLTTNPPTPALAAALAAAQAEMKNPPCDRANSHFYNRYATLASVLDAVRPALNKHGIAVTQPLSNDHPSMITVATVLTHKSGESMESRVSVPLDARIQQIGTAITYLRRYSLTAMLGIVGDEDDDAETIEKPIREAEQAKSAAKAKAKPKPAPELSTPINVERKQGKSGKPFFSVEFESSNGERFSASTFSETVAQRLHASIGQPTQVFFESREQNGRSWMNITDAI